MISSQARKHSSAVPPMAMKSGAVLAPMAGARTRMNRDAMYARHPMISKTPSGSGK